MQGLMTGNKSGMPGLKNLATAGAAEDQRRKVTVAAFQTEWRRSLKR
jgi:hypothetical protein